MVITKSPVPSTGGDVLRFLQIRKDVVFFIIITIFVFGGLGFLFRDRLSQYIPPLGRLFPSLGSVTVRVSTDSDSAYFMRGEEAQLTLENGTLLSFPSNSIIFPGNIKLSEISDIQGMPPGSAFVSGVNIDANEVSIGQPAILNLAIPSNADRKRLAGFVYTGNGEDWHLYPVTITGNTAQFRIRHFSGYGLIEIDRVEFAPPEPSGMQSRMEKLDAELTISDFNSQLSQAAQALDDPPVDAYSHSDEERKTLLREWYTIVRDKYLEPATQDEQLLERAVTEYRDWQFWVEHYFDYQDFASEFAELKRLFNLAVDRGLEEAEIVCSKDHDPSQALVMLRIIYLYQKTQSLAGMNERLGFEDDIFDCLNFQLKITTTYTSGNTCDWPTEKHIGAIDLKSRLGDNEFLLSGQGQVDGDYHNCHGSCRLVAGKQSQTVQLLDMAVNATNDDTPAIELLLKIPDDNSGGSAVSCPEELDNSRVQYDVGWEYILFSHPEEAVGEDTLRITNWETVRQGEVYARKTYNNPNYTGMLTEETVLELLHMPK